MKTIITDGCDKRFVLLCSQLDDYLEKIIGSEKQHSQYVAHNTLEAIHDVILLMDGETPVGCGSFKAYDKETAEIKRVFVNEGYRGQRYGGAIITQLEARAREKGYKRLVLETGKPMKGAIAFYQSLGYEVMSNYGPYVEITSSVCMKKDL